MLSVVQLVSQATGESTGVVSVVIRAYSTMLVRSHFQQRRRLAGVLFTVGHILVFDGLNVDRDGIFQANNDVSSNRDGIVNRFEGLHDFLDSAKAS